MIRRGRRNIRRASGDISTTGGIATGIIVGTGLGILLAGTGYLAGQGTDMILSTREFQDLSQYSTDVGEAAKYAFTAAGGLYGFSRGVSLIPHYRDGIRDWMRRTF